MTDVITDATSGQPAAAEVGNDKTVGTSHRDPSTVVNDASITVKTPDQDGDSPTKQTGLNSPNVAGEKRKTTGDKEPILLPSKRVIESKVGLAGASSTGLRSIPVVAFQV